jgi:CopG family transcriptional regulator, nickel-responsive regulator
LQIHRLELISCLNIENNFHNRSQAIRHLVEKNIAEQKWLCNHMVAGAIVMLYDHHKNNVTNKSNRMEESITDIGEVTGMGQRPISASSSEVDWIDHGCLVNQ